MKPARWQKIKDILARALSLESAARPAFLAKACGDDETLRNEVASFLALEKAADQFLDLPAGKLSPLSQAATPIASAEKSDGSDMIY
jgi:hypothetical protein